MSFNSEELLKIKIATDGFFAKKARITIARALLTLSDRISVAQKLSDAESRKTLISILNEQTKLRQNTLRYGNASYSDPEWAAAAACESWIQEILIGDEEDIASCTTVINEMIRRV